MDDRRWGFAGLDDAEYAQFARSVSSARPSGVERRDDVVVVTLDPDGVSLADDWRARIDPSRLGEEVVVAAARAVAGALAAPVFPPAAPSGVPDLAPWGGSFARLVEDASRDVARFSAAATVAVGRVVERTSAGGHVRGAARHGTVTAVTVDAGWARSAHVRDVEAELLDVLAGLRREAVPEALKHGPSHPATVALQQLAGDPALVARLAGMAP
ncbi:hypothetical protein [Actinomycetospora flava]|uniref:YbaB/EbfC DNA-binding family protein n=1 Tax=Actinomycetospora flava TaxID=3129232 RepID=A0ABU8M7M3_9PSEU